MYSRCVVQNCKERSSKLVLSAVLFTYHLAATLGQAVQAASCLACRHHQDIRPLNAPAHRCYGRLQFVVPGTIIAPSMNLFHFLTLRGRMYPANKDWPWGPVQSIIQWVLRFLPKRVNGRSVKLTLISI